MRNMPPPVGGPRSPARRCGWLPLLFRGLRPRRPTGEVSPGLGIRPADELSLDVNVKAARAATRRLPPCRNDFPVGPCSGFGWRLAAPLLLLALWAAPARAQSIDATSYPFTASTGAALEDMSSGTTQLLGPNLDDN